MSELIRLCLYSSDPQFPLHSPFEHVENLLIIGRAATWTELKDTLKHAGVDLVAVNLDGEDGLDVVKRVTVAAPGCGLIGISSNTDPVTIIKAMRAGCGQFVPWPVDQADLQSAIERIMVARIFGASPSKRICVVGSSGGAGTTTIACNLAMELAHLTNRRCGLVDLNLEMGDVGCVFDCEPRFTLPDLCRDGVGVDNVMVSKAFHDLPCGVSVLVRPDDLTRVREVTPEGIVRMLAVARESFPFVVLDLPRSFSLLSAAAVRDTDVVLVVTQLGVSFIRNATRIYECLCEMGAPEDNIEIVVNRHKAHYQRVTPDDVETHFGKPLFALIPNDYRRVQASLDHGHPIVGDDPNSPVRQAIQQMARRIAGNDMVEDDLADSTGGFLRRFWGKKAPGDPSFTVGFHR